jgi:glyoxylase-like metal-dependent hydrolase (beta-lactamase superfamily II)
LSTATHRLRDGIELVPTPGHTEGSQSVVVETTGGTHALVGDLAYTQHNLRPGLSSIVDATGEMLTVTSVGWNYVPPGTVVDVAACYESIRRLRDRVGRGGMILPGHDASLAGRYPETE